MASLRTTAQQVLEEARDGIAWIALYKEGRGWGASCFWPDFDDRTGLFKFEDYDLDDLKEIIATDKDAILVNGYYFNLGPTEEMTRETLASALRWQYEEQVSRLVDAMEQEGAAA